MNIGRYSGRAHGNIDNKQACRGCSHHQLKPVGASIGNYVLNKLNVGFTKDDIRFDKLDLGHWLRCSAEIKLAKLHVPPVVVLVKSGKQAAASRAGQTGRD